MVNSIARKRKRQFYGNKFTNTSKKNTTSAVPECTASCSKFGKESFSTAEEMPGPVYGNRIVDLELIVEAFAQLCCPKCFAEKVELFEDSRYGLCSHFTLKCKGFAGAFKLCSTLNLPRLTKTAYKNQEAKLLKVVQEVAEESMIKAATEIVEKQQKFSSDIELLFAAMSVILTAMQQNVIAALYHCASSDKKPMHSQCRQLSSPSSIFPQWQNEISPQIWLIKQPKLQINCA
ncbi:uncharacterized protein TNCV_1351701 [Trichonephila clavipes]|nr:uncharacterized protein TNCV_1351701 [Trichonephila clavipes]